MLTSESIKTKARELGFDACGSRAGRRSSGTAILLRVARARLRRFDGVPVAIGRAPARRQERAAVGAIGDRHRHRLQHRPPVFDRVPRSRPRAHRPLRVGRRLSRRARRPARHARSPGCTRCIRNRSKRVPYVDTGPIQERVYAQHAGVGWIGKNSCVIHPDLGSWLFLAEIICSLPLDPDVPAFDQCGTLHAVPRGLPDARAGRAGCSRRDAVHFVLDHRASRRYS